MSFDGVVTRAVVDELSTKLTSGRILKIYQPTSTELVMTVRSHGENHKLLLSVHPSYARIHLTSESLTNPKEPPMFCMLLRKYLAGGFIEKIEQKNMERIIAFRIYSKDEIGDITSKTLMVEIMGKHSNIMLVDDEKNVILDSMKHISPAQNRHRTILPGQPYVFPPEQNKLHPLEIDGERFIKKLDFNKGKLDQQMVHTLMGISPLIAKELQHRAHLGSTQKYQEVFERFQKDLREHNYTPAVYQGGKEQFYVFILDSLPNERITFSSVSEMLDAYYRGKAERDRVKQQTADIYRLLKNERDKNKRKIKKHQQTLKKAEKAEQYQKLGELLTANMHLVKTGDTVVKVVDYYDPDQSELEIELNPNKTPSENAQSLFQTYQKLKKSKQVVTTEIDRAKDEIQYLEQLMQQLETAREQDLEEIREELQEQGYIRKKAKKSKKKQNQKPQLDEYEAADGTLILVGRNNKQNEYLTNRLANKDEIWLHAKDIPGSHVVIRTQNPSQETIEEAAELAAFYSKSKMSSTVPIDYTQVKHVRKPSGAKPGYVIYDNQKTVYVTPDERKVNQMKRSQT
ncbi:NFACT RNA binding domain-containing protein [Salinibacillus aidingensis]|uniref:Rqc2 homolog RqcH n=1 Tax=Salinibacillus aidingensis TaxID=237684 RepID=A0ABP3L9P0_9BACI